RRIAAGSGTRVEDVNRLLRQLEDTKKMMKQMSGMKHRGRMPMGGMPPGGMPF
ncbi:MAG: signal recognition particle protein, partial [Angelakisella sp.]